MKTLLIWECGQDLGHISHLATIAKVLHDLGSDIFLCVKDEVNIANVFQSIPYKLIPFPKLNAPISHRPTFSMADVLIRRGMSDKITLSKQFKKWQAVYQAVEPDLVVYDFSPTALFSSVGLDFKKVIIDSTWGAAPPGKPFLPLNLWQPMPEDHIPSSELKLIQTMNSVLENASRPKLQYVSDIFNADKTLISNYKELDIYGPQRQDVNYLGPIFFNTSGEAITVGSGKKRIFIYLKEDRKISTLALHSIVKFPQVEAHFFIPNVSLHLRTSLERLGFSVYSKPIALQRYISKFDLILCHGGTGTTGVAIKTGVPVLVFPTQLEQRNVGELIARSGAGLAVDEYDSIESISTKLEALLSEERFKMSCKEIRRSVPTSNSINTQIRALLQPLCV
ncbi:glycosyltransferase [Reinekea sp.]|jgi:UDP-N-acetylglucosamine transferase subunit ALG13|uniref:glycosyltransferase n=2 Tax=Reinekea sp. TaxID=1970455 RepID=UPI0039893170